MDSNVYTILIADDDKINLDVLGFALQDEYNIVVARSGKSALKFAEKNRPDLILLDIIMDDMHGFDVIRELKSNPELTKIPVIFITGLTSPEDEEKGLSLGAVDYIHKPFSSAVVRARVSSQIRAIQQTRNLERFGLIDSLTELSNRRGFDNMLEIEWARGLRNQTPISLLVIDIDFFKVVNDTYGHLHGDIMLRNIAKSIVTSVRRTTDLVYRWAGEEFAVILSETSIDGAYKVAENIRSAVENAGYKTIKDGEDAVITISIGVATMQPELCETITSQILLGNADQALYMAKRSGRNKVCVF